MSVTIARLSIGDADSKFCLYAVGEGENFPVIDFLEQLQQFNENSYNRLMAELGHVATEGPITNDKRKSRLLHSDPKIFEFKTPDQNRIAWFYDKGHVIICTNGFPKPKKKALKQEIGIAISWHARYFQAKSNNQLMVIENEQHN